VSRIRLLHAVHAEDPQCIRHCPVIHVTSPIVTVF
jgi:hypothetical protein